MERKAKSGIMLILLIISMLTLAFNVQPAKASGIIYIRADGSVQGTDNITSVDNVTYTFTGNIFDAIVVERDNIVVDGAGYTLQGTGILVSNGIDLSGRSNVTIQNINIKEFVNGIQLGSSFNCTVKGNNVTNGYYGILLYESSNNSINGNNITANNVEGISLTYSSYNRVHGNNITANNWNGIDLAFSSNNSVSGNYIAANSMAGIVLRFSSSNNSMNGNDVTANNETGIYLRGSSYNGIEGNNITANLGDGICLRESSNNNSINRNNITTNSGSGIGLESSSNNSVSGNNITNNEFGVSLIYSSDNSIYHNNFIDNTIQAYASEGTPTNFLDDGYPSGGNYWSDYTGVDEFSGPNQNQLGTDGIGDTPRIVDDYNVDYYPLMNQWALTRAIQTSVKVGGQEYAILIETNATLTHIRATSVTLRFQSSGISGQTYYINVTFPQINQTEINVFIDGERLTPPPFPIITANSTHYFIYFEFTASTHDITIQYATTNIATTNLTTSKTIIGAGYTTSINVTVENQGIYTETFNVTVYADLNTTIIGDEITVGIQNVTLPSGNSTTLTLTWNTTGVAKGNYTITAEATQLPGETDTTDNTHINGIVLVTIPGDANGDGFVDVSDFAILGAAWFKGPGMPGYDPCVDFDDDDFVDVSDFAILGKYWFQGDC